jgi:hypothetical protein
MWTCSRRARPGSPADVELKVQRIKHLEHEGDQIAHQFFSAIGRTWITPIALAFDFIKGLHDAANSIATVGTRVEPRLILASLAGAITSNLLTWWWGLPSSSSHALIGAEAMCKFEGFTCAPSETVYWQHGRSTARVAALPLFAEKDDTATEDPR